MKTNILIMVFILGVISTASAAEVCRIKSFSYDESSAKGSCTAEAFCTDPSINVRPTEVRQLQDFEITCKKAEVRAIKALLDLGYKLETSDTLVKY